MIVTLKLFPLLTAGFCQPPSSFAVSHLSRKMIPWHFLACNWSCFVCSEYSPVTSVAVSLEKKMLSIKMSANFHHAFTKDSQVFETRQWNADYKVIRTPNIYCLLKMLYWQFRWKSLLFCSLQDCGSLTFKYQSCLWYFS